MNTLLRTLSFAVAGVIATSLTGCETMPFQKRDDTAPIVESGSGAPMLGETYTPVEPMDPVPTGLPLATTQRFADIPLPLGVKEDMDRTYVFESQGFRVGRMVYTTRDSVPDVAQFFIRECPVASWQLSSAVQAEGVQLQFRKANERLDITVHSPGTGRANVLILHLTPLGGAGVN